MVFCRGGEDAFCSFVTDGAHELLCDIPVDRGGKDAGFRPSTLIEGALAACVNITLRHYAQTRGIKLSDVVVRVSMNNQDPKKILMEQQVQLIGDLTEKEREDLLQVAERCPVNKIVSGEFAFHMEESRSDIKLEPAPKKIFA